MTWQNVYSILAHKMLQTLPEPYVVKTKIWLCYSCGKSDLKIFRCTPNIKKSPPPTRYQYELLKCYPVVFCFIFLLNCYGVQYLKCRSPFRKNMYFLYSTTAINRHTDQNKGYIKLTTYLLHTTCVC